MFRPTSVPPVRARKLRTGAAAALCALAVSAGLLATPPPAAEAQTAQPSLPYHVSNLARASFNPGQSFFYLANGFTTGGSAGDSFTLTSVAVRIHSAASITAAEVYTNSGNNPGTQVGGDMVQQGSATSGLITFNAPSGGITLDGATTYFLRIHGQHITALATNSNQEDAGSSPGWSIANGYLVSGNGTAWQSAGHSLLFRVNATGPLPDRLQRLYGWCFNRPSADACLGHINRWDSLAQQRNPITVSLDNDGNTEKRCPSTHQIRKATTSGIKCERTYAPVLPAAGALAEAWGVTEIAPPSSLRDGWDGATRSCEPQSRGYVVLTTTRWHGLNQGCHAHSAIGGAHHEHTRQNH